MGRPLADSHSPRGIHNEGIDLPVVVVVGKTRAARNCLHVESGARVVLLDMGIAGGVLALWLFIRALRRPPGAGGASRAERNFWLLLVPFTVILGIASTGERDYFGVAHLTLLPLAALGLALIAAAFPWSRRVTVLVFHAARARRQ